jgi:hypothetical protein
LASKRYLYEANWQGARPKLLDTARAYLGFRRYTGQPTQEGALFHRPWGWTGAPTTLRLVLREALEDSVDVRVEVTVRGPLCDLVDVRQAQAELIGLRSVLEEGAASAQPEPAAAVVAVLLAVLASSLGAGLVSFGVLSLYAPDSPRLFALLFWSTFLPALAGFWVLGRGWLRRYLDRRWPLALAEMPLDGSEARTG